MRSSLPALTAALLLSSSLSVRALVAFNDGRDEIFITVASGLSYDSNLYATADGEDDTSLNASVDLDYKRKAGVIGVNGNFGFNFAAFDENSSENYTDPRARAEFTKTGGRTTGSLVLNGSRISRADSLLNLRTTYWTYGGHLTCKYPVIQRYSIGADVAYDKQDYAGGSTLFDIDTYSAGSDLFYRYTSERDILAGYRLRVTDTTADTRSYDHSLTIGTTGKLGAKLAGTVRAGYQFRKTDRSARGGDDTYSAFTTSAATTWTVTRRLNIVAQASRDFSTVATDSNTDTTAGSLDAVFAANAKLKLSAGTGAGRVRFLSDGASRRHDTYLNFNAGAAYTLNEHLTVSLNATHQTNWSTLELADYKRHTISLLVSSRW